METETGRSQRWKIKKDAQYEQKVKRLLFYCPWIQQHPSTHLTLTLLPLFFFFYSHSYCHSCSCSRSRSLTLSLLCLSLPAPMALLWLFLFSPDPANQPYISSMIIKHTRFHRVKKKKKKKFKLSVPFYGCQQVNCVFVCVCVCVFSGSQTHSSFFFFFFSLLTGESAFFL